MTCSEVLRISRGNFIRMGDIVFVTDYNKSIIIINNTISQRFWIPTEKKSYSFNNDA